MTHADTAIAPANQSVSYLTRRRLLLLWLLMVGLGATCFTASAEAPPVTAPPTINGPFDRGKTAATNERAGRVGDAARRLLLSYPEQLAAVEGNLLIWRDGTRMPLDDGTPEKSFDAWLAAPDLKDMFRTPYPAGVDAAVPPFESDPGRARNAAFFAKMYGDCRRGGVAPTLVDVAWLPSRSRATLKITRVNGVDAKLARIVEELDALPAAYDRFLRPSAGTYNCRPVAGTAQASTHGYGIAIDIALKHAHYWRWSKPGADGRPLWRNEIPREVVAAFERHGFIWGGRWSHFDTMHFEYRPELLLP